MTEHEWRMFVSHGTRTGKLAVTRASGEPHVTPIWFLLDDAPSPPEIVFTVWGDSLKARVLRRSPHFSLCVDDQAPPYSYVQLNGTARLDDNPAELLTWATRLGNRYMGQENAAAYGRRNAVPGEFLVRARIDRIIARSGIADQGASDGSANGP
ncbi:PPOX class F420-dependent oxidoreductase [Streptomyces sp. NPDC053427]|uniref:PPOX class F420-dependent oxidoreductase n=1 Tax=Streptomyces sp. NPDC053427 TaxID=3365701 RepID=UPI0037D2BAB7